MINDLHYYFPFIRSIFSIENFIVLHLNGLIEGIQFLELEQDKDEFLIF